MRISLVAARVAPTLFGTRAGTAPTLCHMAGNKVRKPLLFHKPHTWD